MGHFAFLDDEEEDEVIGGGDEGDGDDAE